MNELIAITCFIAVVTACKHLYNKFTTEREQEQEQEQQQYTISDYQQIKQQVTALQQTIQRIDSLNNLIIDISICSADSLKNVCISVPDSISNNSTHSFIIDGTDNNSKLLKGLATKEQQQLTTILLRQIENLYLMICSDGNSDANELHLLDREVMQHE